MYQPCAGCRSGWPFHLLGWVDRELAGIGHKVFIGNVTIFGVSLGAVVDDHGCLLWGCCSGLGWVVLAGSLLLFGWWLVPWFVTQWRIKLLDNRGKGGTPRRNDDWTAMTHVEDRQQQQEKEQQEKEQQEQASQGQQNRRRCSRPSSLPFSFGLVACET